VSDTSLHEQVKKTADAIAKKVSILYQPASRIDCWISVPMSQAWNFHLTIIVSLAEKSAFR
jgi:hypothetical protein